MKTKLTKNQNGIRLKDHLRGQLHLLAAYAIALLKWLLFAALTGGIVGCVGAGFHLALEKATEFRVETGWPLYLLPVAGVFIVWAYHVTKMQDDKGTEFIIRSVRDGQHLRLRTAPLIFVSTVLTHFTGGSAGREGAALQLGGSISNSIGRLLRLDDKDGRVITMCGMAAGFSALFGTPIAAAILSMEIVSVGVMYYSAIVPCVLSALIAKLVATALGVAPTVFAVSAVPVISGAALGKLIVLGALCGLVAILFCKVMHLAPKLYSLVSDNPYIRVLLGSAIIIGLTLLLGRDYGGAGIDVIRRALDGTARPEAFFLKMVFTALTLAAGFKGGEIVPAFFCGATFGCFYGTLLGLPASFAAAVGIVAVFCGVTNCPLTSILLAYELFGGEGLPMYTLAIAVSYMLSGYTGLWHAQKIVYSKLRPEYVNRDTE